MGLGRMRHGPGPVGMLIIILITGIIIGCVDYYDKHCGRCLTTYPAQRQGDGND